MNDLSWEFAYARIFYNRSILYSVIDAFAYQNTHESFFDTHDVINTLQHSNEVLNQLESLTLLKKWIIILVMILCCGRNDSRDLEKFIFLYNHILNYSNNYIRNMLFFLWILVKRFLLVFILIASMWFVALFKFFFSLQV